MKIKDYRTLHYAKIEVKEQLAVRKYMGVNENERLSTITLRHKFN